MLTADGEILTDHHVIQGATAVTVIDPATGKRYPVTDAAGRVVGMAVGDDEMTANVWSSDPTG